MDEAHLIGLDESIAAKLTPLRVPIMQEAARNVFRGLVAYKELNEQLWVDDELSLALARDFMAHPCDWFPTTGFRALHTSPIDDLYQPWVDELAELEIRYAGLPTFHKGVTPTTENWHRHASPVKSFEVLLKRDRSAAQNLLSALETLKWESSKCAVIKLLGGHPSDTPFLEHFASKGSEQVRHAATEVLEKMAGEATMEGAATTASRYFIKSGDRLTKSETHDFDRANRVLKKTNVDLVARQFGLSVMDFAKAIDVECFGDFAEIVGRTGDKETRSLFAKRMLAEGTARRAPLYRDVSPELWELASEQAFKQPYYGVTLNHHGFGVLTTEQILDWFSPGFVKLTCEKPPQRNSLPHDPLRIVGLAADKSAAQFFIDEALRCGLDEADPRLLNLRFNLSL